MSTKNSSAKVDKQKIISALLEEIETEFQILVSSANSAKEGATSTESKAENKYDTRGLEASYLAGAQALRADELRKTLVQFKNLELRDYSDNKPIDITALVSLEDQDGKIFHYFIVPFKGGIRLNIDSNTVTTLSPQAPLGQKIKGKVKGDEFEFIIKGSEVEYLISDVV